jgi:anion transporter
VVPQDWVDDVLEAKVVWLILGAFLLGEALTRSGLATRLTLYLASSARSPRGLAWRLTGALVALAFLVPSTTGRAALLLPLLRSLPPTPENRLYRCLSLLIPCIVLVSTPVTLTGAASHLLANEMLSRAGHAPLSFAGWLVLAGPFGLVASFLTAVLVIGRHLPKSDELLPVTEQPTCSQQPTRSWQPAEWTTLVVLAGMLVLWLTVGLHPLSFTTVMLLGAIVLVAPLVGVLDWKQAIKSVPWDVLIFAGSAVWLGKALVESGASGWLVAQIVAATCLGPTSSTLVVLLLLSIIAITAHVYLTSHTARVAALVPPLLALAAELGWNPAAVVFVTVIGIDYCLTFPVSSKAILLYEFDRTQAAELFRLSLILMPVYLLLMLAFYFLWWMPLGLAF